MKLGTINMNGHDYEVRNAYSCGPGEKPHSFDIPGGHVYEIAGVWKYSPRIGPEYQVTVDPAGYSPPAIQ